MTAEEFAMFQAFCDETVSGAGAAAANPAIDLQFKDFGIDFDSDVASTVFPNGSVLPCAQPHPSHRPAHHATPEDQPLQAPEAASGARAVPDATNEHVPSLREAVTTASGQNMFSVSVLPPGASATALYKGAMVSGSSNLPQASIVSEGGVASASTDDGLPAAFDYVVASPEQTDAAVLPLDQPHPSHPPAQPATPVFQPPLAPEVASGPGAVPEASNEHVPAPAPTAATSDTAQVPVVAAAGGERSPVSSPMDEEAPTPTSPSVAAPAMERGQHGQCQGEEEYNSGQMRRRCERPFPSEEGLWNVHQSQGICSFLLLFESLYSLPCVERAAIIRFACIHH